MKTKIINTLKKRAEYFESISHSYEARELRSAIDTIERLVPPEEFQKSKIAVIGSSDIDIQEAINKNKDAIIIFGGTVSETKKIEKSYDLSIIQDIKTKKEGKSKYHK